MSTARELADRLAALLRREHAAMADFILALAEFDRRRLWRDLGHTSLFYFLRRDLKLSAGAAQYRKTAAELVQNLPAVEAPLRDGRLCLSSIVELAKVLTEENLEEVLPRFFGLSRREAAEVAVSIRPAEVIPRREVILPLRTAGAAQVTLARTGDFDAISFRPAETIPELTPPALPPPREVTRPLDAERSRYCITVSRRFLAKVEAAKDALSHARPNATAEEVLEEGLDLLLAERARRKGMVKKPRKTPPPSDPASDAIPAHVKREVWSRGEGRCEFVLDSGERCGCTRRLELDHLRPRALGGRSTVDNLRITCRAHNQLAARRAFGGAWMDKFTRKRTASG